MFLISLNKDSKIILEDKFLLMINYQNNNSLIQLIRGIKNLKKLMNLLQKIIMK